MLDKGLEDICKRYEVVLLDTSMIGMHPYIPLNKEEARLMEVFGYKRNKAPLIQRIEYSKDIINLIQKNQNVKITNNVLIEMQKGFQKLRKNKVLVRKYRELQLNIYSQLIKRKLNFINEEKENLTNLGKSLFYFKKRFKLSPTDYDLFLHGVNSAVYIGDTSILTNDRSIVKTGTKFKSWKLPKSIKNPKYKVELYHALNNGKFENNKPFPNLGYNYLNS